MCGREGDAVVCAEKVCSSLDKLQNYSASFHGEYTFPPFCPEAPSSELQVLKILVFILATPLVTRKAEN